MKQKKYDTPRLTRYGDFSALTQVSRMPGGLPQWIDPLGPLPIGSDPPGRDVS